MGGVVHDGGVPFTDEDVRCNAESCGIALQRRILRTSLNSKVIRRCDTAEATFSRTVVLPPSIVYNRSVFYAILASDPLCRITVTVNSPQFFRLECP
ncbi:hypothetical protein D3C85_1569730 [compost metagenome]